MAAWTRHGFGSLAAPGAAGSGPAAAWPPAQLGVPDGRRVIAVAALRHAQRADAVVVQHPERPGAAQRRRVLRASGRAAGVTAGSIRNPAAAAPRMNVAVCGSSIHGNGRRPS